MTADQRLDQRLSAGWVEQILGELARTYDPATRTGKKVASHVRWMMGFFIALGIECWSEITAEDAYEWFFAETRNPDGSFNIPELNTARNRQWTLILAFEAAVRLGALVDPAAVAGPKIKQPTDTGKKARPLDDDEDQRICSFADPGVLASMRSVVVAVMRSGGSAPHAAEALVKDVDLDKATIRFPDGRVCELDDWSKATIARYLDANPALGGDDRLCVKPGTAADRAVESVTAQIWKVISEAGFARCPGISGRSLRLTAARRAFERDRKIEAAARVLGSASLDGTARAIGYDWQTDPIQEPLGSRRRGCGAAPGAEPEAGGGDG